ncbi:MAG: ribonuclease H family protein [Acidimicrobiales bacterium]
MPSSTSAEKIVCYTDGACLGNPGPGGWAWATGKDLYRSGAAPATTNQRMELTAVLRALEALSGPIQVVSDSTYVVNCFRDSWWRGWRARGWKNSKGEQVANQDLWKPLIGIAIDERGGEVEFRWVKGHASSAGNNLVDALANEAARLQSGKQSGRIG